MRILKKVAFKNTIFFSIILIIITVGLTSIPLNFLLSDFLDKQSINYIAGILEQTVVSLLLILMLKKFQLLHAAGFSNIRQWKDLWIVWPIVIFFLLNASDFFSGTLKINMAKPWILILYILVYTTTGLFEETLCRGVILTLFLQKWGRTKRGCFFALLLSSIIFGFTHIIHYFLHDASLLATLTQMTYATFIGILFGALVLRNRSIFPAIFLHALFDITGSLNEISVTGGMKKIYLTITPMNAIISILIMLPLALYGLFLFRKVSPAESSLK